MMKTNLGAVAAVLLAVCLGGCVTSGGQAVSVGDRTTLMYGWENHFGIEWAVDAPTADTRAVHGRVYVLAPIAVERMRLLVQASDAAGHPVAQQLVWLPGGLTGGGGTYFEAFGLPVADQYRVTVWDYTLFESVGNMF